MDKVTIAKLEVDVPERDVLMTVINDNGDLYNFGVDFKRFVQKSHFNPAPNLVDDFAWKIIGAKLLHLISEIEIAVFMRRIGIMADQFMNHISVTSAANMLFSTIELTYTNIHFTQNQAINASYRRPLF